MGGALAPAVGRAAGGGWPAARRCAGWCRRGGRSTSWPNSTSPRWPGVVVAPDRGRQRPAGRVVSDQRDQPGWSPTGWGGAGDLPVSRPALPGARSVPRRCSKTPSTKRVLAALATCTLRTDGAWGAPPLIAFRTSRNSFRPAQTRWRSAVGDVCFAVSTIANGDAVPFEGRRNG